MVQARSDLPMLAAQNYHSMFVLNRDSPLSGGWFLVIDPIPAKSTIELFFPIFPELPIPPWATPVIWVSKADGPPGISFCGARFATAPFPQTMVLTYMNSTAGLIDPGEQLHQIAILW